MNSLLLEIRTEEIPAGYIKPALKALALNLFRELSDSRIEYGVAKVFGTPNRLAILVSNVADKQSFLESEIMGPPKRIGFDENGKPTLAAIKFAEKAGIDIGSIKIKETKKGSYLYAKKTEAGQASKAILKKILPEIILSLPFPKTMRWADLTISFARPIQSILALLGKSLIPFTLGNIKSGRFTFGHRFMPPDGILPDQIKIDRIKTGKIKIDDPDSYVATLLRANVFVDIDERKNIIKKEISETATRLGGQILPDDQLVEIVTNLVEYPAVVAGKFDHKFLELPDEVLITAMREHQKYFGVIDESKKLMPCFIAVNNTCAKDMDLVANGHERVLRARLEDARFFYKTDIDEPIENRIDKLKGVLFQADLGSLHNKVGRISVIAEFLADACGADQDLKKDVLRASRLCKADLVTQVVVEFPKLQGVMGRIYAGLAGESDVVASAIEEHYRPAFSGGPLPETKPAAILGIADKIDTICGCFSVGLIPTGASDPYALRRNGIGIIQIMLDKNFSFSLRSLVEKSLGLFEKKSDKDSEKTIDEVCTFLQNRMTHLLIEEGYAKDVISSVVSVSMDHVPNVLNRVRALDKLKKEPDFQPLAIAFKRIVNIIKKTSGFEDKTVDTSVFQENCESALYSKYREVKNMVAENMEKGCFDQALYDIATLRDGVDDFFDGVMVMAEDEMIRSNRLTLLHHIAKLFEMFADFSKIST